jgi:cytochrome c oxidase cbb3-type subunit IV
MDYQTLRTFADSWVLLAMTVFFVGVVIWVMRPSARSLHEDAASIPFKDSAND